MSEKEDAIWRLVLRAFLCPACLFLVAVNSYKLGQYSAVADVCAIELPGASIQPQELILLNCLLGIGIAWLILQQLLGDMLLIFDKLAELFFGSGREEEEFPGKV